MNLDQRVSAYMKQRREPTPAMRRRCIKKARRDLLNLAKGAEQPSDETFEIAMSGGFQLKPVNGHG